MPPLLLGGVLPLDGPARERWNEAGTRRMPVGRATDFATPSAGGDPAFQLNRGLERSRRGRVTHQGADLANGRAGDTVRAAASGLVLLAFDGDNGNGYGGHVVLAHRVLDGSLAYTVYAHLARGSIGVHAGDAVVAGDPLALVGRTGRASTPHLHFEVRTPLDPNVRWERAPVVDPLAWIESRMTEPAETEDGAEAYVDWARHEALLAADADPDAPLTRAAWWRMLAKAAGAEADADAPPAQLRDALIDEGVLPEEEGGAPHAERLAWAELARDVKRLQQLGVRSPHGPLTAADHAAECEARFGESRPAAHTGALRHLPDDPTGADACVLLADVSGPRTEADLRPDPPAKGKVKGKSASKHGKGKAKKRGKARPAKPSGKTAAKPHAKPGATSPRSTTARPRT